MKSIKAFIPNRISNRTLTGFLEILRRRPHSINGSRMPDKEFSIKQGKHELENENIFVKHLADIKQSKGFIEDQKNYKEMSFGRVDMAYAGCEIIAVYNALRSLNYAGELYTLPRLISYFENDGMLLGGRFGTSPKALKTFFDKLGFITAYSLDEADFEGLAREYDTSILTFYNDKDDIFKQIHTINISKSVYGYAAHNVYGNKKPPALFSSFEKLTKSINGGKAKGIMFIGIKRAGR